MMSDENVEVPDPFKFTKRSFKKKQDEESDDDDDSDDDDVVEVKKVKRSTIELAVEDDDDDSDIEVTATTTTKPVAVPEAIHNALLDDDDDEDDSAYVNTAEASAILKNQLSSSIQAIVQARNAKKRLQQAQAYRGEDVRTFCEVDYKNQPLVELPSQAKLGVLLELSIQLHSPSLPNNPTIPASIRNFEPLQKLVDRVCEQCNLKQGDLHLENASGETLDLTKVPASYKMTSGQFLVLKQKPLRVKAKNLGPLLNLVLRTLKGGELVSEDTFPLRLKEPFLNLAEAYRKEKGLPENRVVELSFEGELLNLLSTPHAHEMEDEEIIEVNLL
jgi:hypothetical protein